MTSVVPPSVPPSVPPCACGCVWDCSYGKSQLTAAQLSDCAQSLIRSKEELRTDCGAIDFWLKNHPQDEPDRIKFALALMTKQQTLFSVQSRIEQVRYHQRERCIEELKIACDRLDLLSGPISCEEGAYLCVKIHELQKMRASLE